MEEIADIADRILVMNRGNVEMFDTVENVFSQVEKAFGNRLKCILKFHC